MSLPQWQAVCWKPGVENDTQLPHCERLVYVCSSSSNESFDRSGPVFVWSQVNVVEQSTGSNADSPTSGTLHEQDAVMSCDRCRELAQLTVEVFDGQSEESVFSSQRVVCDPGICPTCSQLVETAAGRTAPLLPTSESPLLEFCDLPNEQTKIVLVDPSTLQQAQERIIGCENCADEAEITFDYLLDAVTGNDPTVTQYVLYSPAKCPHCFHEVNEKTLVVPE